MEEKGPRDLTLVDTCFVAELPKLEPRLHDEGYDIKGVNRLILTNSHVDHRQAADEVKKTADPRKSAEVLDNLGIRVEDVVKRYGSLEVGPS